MHARRIFSQCADIWPIKESAGRKPEGWVGWPEGKQFALVLTHDVESQAGLNRVRQLAEMEIRLGVRSSFNFIPEGPYAVSKDLLEWLVGNGFEVGVHDLHHDGHLYQSRAGFAQKARRINHYIKEWGAAGFRSAFMLNELDWIHDLNVQYDSSTFDTDPFEPQPDGVGTIFPFWAPAPAGQQSGVESQRSAVGGQKSDGLTTSETLNSRYLVASEPGEGGSTTNHSRGGYVELPYTLPQDSTLFCVLRMNSIDLWKKKSDWVARSGGMLLLDTHPDYMTMEGDRTKAGQYPVTHYRDLLCYLSASYDRKYWHVLPRQMADWVYKSRARGSSFKVSPCRVRRRPKIWIDLDNTPHVPLFEPIVDELQARGFPLLITARDAFQVCELAREKQLDCTKIGRHYGKHRLLKGVGLVYRALQLAPTVLREKPVVALSHGARSQLLISNWLRIPTILMEDYEHCEFPCMMRPSWMITPEVIPDSAIPLPKDRIRKYQGTKEAVYVWKLRPDFSVLEELGLKRSDLIATVRPPATEAHYHNPESELLFERFMERAGAIDNARVVLLPRNRKQGDFLQARWPHWFSNDRTIIPRKALDGLNLIFNSDLVVSGGGTMNREAAALGIPVYSIFRGEIGAVDKSLSAEGRLVLIESTQDVEEKIPLVKHQRKSIADMTSTKTLQDVVDQIEEIAEQYCREL